MEKLIDLHSYPVETTLKILLQDKTTKQNIIWATDTYADSIGCRDVDAIELERLLGIDPVYLQPRIQKTAEEQQARTRKKAEVFTPVWICNQMNNYVDQEWFGRSSVFNVETDHGWDTVEDAVVFPENKSWKAYVDSRRLEITCGEAPFLVSRYDSATGEYILPPKRRIGLLDRKLRIVNENTSDYEEWIKWTLRAFQSCYGYEYQGDNLLIARINLIMTYFDYYVDRWEDNPPTELLKKIANIISWNLWQMDGLQDTVPLGKPQETYHQTTMFELLGMTQNKPRTAPFCKIRNWRSKETMVFHKVKG